MQKKRSKTRGGTTTVAALCGTLAMLLGTLSGCAMLQPAAPVLVALENAVIQIPPGPLSVHRYAAAELQRHLEAIAGSAPPPVVMGAVPSGRGYIFRVGQRDPRDHRALQPEEGRYSVDTLETFFYGADATARVDADPQREVVLHLENGVGTLFAVYAFLERECGVRWPAPGETDFSRRGSILRLRRGRTVWRPKLRQRTVRAGNWDWAKLEPVQAVLPLEFQVARTTASGRAWAESVWLRRHRIGSHAGASAQVRQAQDPAQSGKHDRAPDVAAAPAVVKLPAGTTGKTAACVWRRTARATAGALVHRATVPPADVGLPLGQAERVFDLFQLGRRHGLTGTDYLLAPGSWWLDGLTCYALVRALAEPDAPFGRWEREFCDGFGPAAEDVRRYYAFWRAHYAAQLAPAAADLSAAGYGSWERGLCEHVTDYFALDDFRAAVAYLHTGLSRPLTPTQKRRLQELIVAHEHSELIFLALRATQPLHEQPDRFKASLKAARRLTAFRRDWRYALKHCLPRLMAQELALGDCTGTAWAALFEDAEPYLRLPLLWHFKRAPEAAGAERAWPGLNPATVQAWERIAVNRPWADQNPADCTQAQVLRDYAGAAWYATNVTVDSTLRDRDVFVNLRGFAGHCRVYMNGQLVGEHGDDPAGNAAVSFRVRIDPGFSERDGEQLLMIEVLSPGQNAPRGIRRPVWLSTRNRPDAATATAAP